MDIKQALAAVYCTMTAMVAGPVAAQEFPAKPIRLITTTVGSGSDYTARVVAQEVTATLGQPVVVDNRSGTLPSVEAVAKAPPDGYSLLVAGGTFWITPLLQKTSYDP